jgi:hypothetical protein
MPRLLRTDLPDDVWNRLDAEAASHGQKIGKYVQGLILARDQRKYPTAEFPETVLAPSTTSNKKESDPDE